MKPLLCFSPRSNRIRQLVAAGCVCGFATFLSAQSSGTSGAGASGSADAQTAPSTDANAETRSVDGKQSPEAAADTLATDVEASDLKTWSGTAAEPTRRTDPNGTTGTSVQPGTSTTLGTPPTVGAVGSAQGSDIEREATVGTPSERERSTVSTDELERAAERRRRDLERARTAPVTPAATASDSNQRASTAEPDTAKKKEFRRANDPTTTAPRDERAPRKTETQPADRDRSPTQAPDAEASSKAQDSAPAQHSGSSGAAQR